MRPEDQRDHLPRYTMVPRTLIFITRGEKLLLLQGATDKKLWAGKYNGIGGHIEPGETPYTAAQRELMEETGLCVESLAFRAAIHIQLPTPPGIMLFVFTGESSEGMLRPSEEGAPVWVNRETLPTLPVVEDIPELLSRVLDPGPFIFGRYYFDDHGLHTEFHPVCLEMR